MNFPPLWYVIFSSDKETYTKVRLILSSYGYIITEHLGYDSTSNYLLRSSVLLKSKSTYVTTESEQIVSLLTKNMYVELKIEDILKL